MRYLSITSVVVLILQCCAIDVYAQSTWQRLLPVVSHTVAVNPLNPSTMIVGSKFDAVHRTRDGGETWDTTYVRDMPTMAKVTTVVISRADTNVVLVAGWGFDGIKRSTDGGTTWKNAIVARPAERLWFVSEAIVEDPSSPGTFYGASSPDFNAIYKSTNNGETWDSMSVVPKELTKRLCTISIRPDSTNILYAGCLGGTIVRSSDAGMTWATVPILDGTHKIFTDTEIPKIVFTQSNPMIGYAVATIGGANSPGNDGGIFKTTDGGLSWNRTAYKDTSLWAVETRLVGNTEEVFVGGFQFSIQFNNIAGAGIVARSVDSGVSFTQYPDIEWPPIDNDSTRNVWVFRYNTGLKKMFMCAATGFYVLNEVTSVAEQRSSLTTANYHNGRISIGATGDDVQAVRGNSWTLYDMQARVIAHGTIHEETLHTGVLQPGLYILNYGSDTARIAARVLVN